MRGVIAATLALAVGGTIVGGCGIPLPESTHTCSLVGCVDQLTATVTGPDAALPAGTHLLTVTADAVTTTCTFKVPSDTLPGGGTVGPSCPQGLSVSVGQKESCTETKTSTTSSLTCTPVAGQ